MSGAVMPLASFGPQLASWRIAMPRAGLAVSTGAGFFQDGGGYIHGWVASERSPPPLDELKDERR
jgi:hypothetical protein